jgi:peptide/nickel transport system substrate-binding protein
MRLLDALPDLPETLAGGGVEGGRLRAGVEPEKARPSEMPGLGPFVLASYTQGKRVVLTRNPRYWRRDAGGAALPHVDRLTLEIVPDRNAEALRLISGQVDLLQDQIRAEDYREGEGGGG